MGSLFLNNNQTMQGDDVYDNTEYIRHIYF